MSEVRSEPSSDFALTRWTFWRVIKVLRVLVAMRIAPADHVVIEIEEMMKARTQSFQDGFALAAEYAEKARATEKRQ